MLRLHLSRCATNLRHARPRLFSAKPGDVAVLEGKPFKEVRIGVPREVADGEKRVASTPESVALLVKKGFKVSIQSGAGLPVSVRQRCGPHTGHGAMLRMGTVNDCTRPPVFVLPPSLQASFRDEYYAKAGADIVSDASAVLGADVVLKVRPPNLTSEVGLLKPGARLISYVQPAQNAALLDALVKQGTTAFAMDQASRAWLPDMPTCFRRLHLSLAGASLQIPRISRAQVFDALSSMSSIAGYRAVIEACAVYGRLLMGQITAAGRVQPSKARGARRVP